MELLELGHAKICICDCCEHAVCELDHILWICPDSKPAREEADEELANVDTSLLSKAIKKRRGTSHVMQTGGHFLGTGVGHGQLGRPEDKEVAWMQVRHTGGCVERA